MTVIEAATEVIELARGCGAAVTALSVEGSLAVEPAVTVRFGDQAGLAAFAAADRRARVEEVSRLHGPGAARMEYWASYDRPGRKMLAVHYCFPHCADFPPACADLPA
jgi:hypothetical protein